MAKSLVEIADGQNVFDLSYDELERFSKREYSYEGFRLERVDVYNWGSFNNNVKTVYFGGQNVLMTGDNGAGKSSIIDAITVLLYDVQRIVFNQAAGADKGERNLASYVLGLYKNDNSSGVKTEMGLRSKDKAVLSIIMASFYNRNLNEHVVLIHCMIMNKGNNNVDRYYYISPQDFNLELDILPVKDIKELSYKLKNIGAIRYKSFREYYSQMQRQFGIEGTKVLDLFYKTISMKSIANISEFVRKQMLEDFNGDSLVDEIIDRFNDLDAAYRAVEEAKKQVEALEPIVDKGEEFANLKELIVQNEECLNGASPYLYVKKSEFLKQNLEHISQRRNEIDSELVKVREQIDNVNADLLSTRDNLALHGGNRRDIIVQNIKSEQKHRDLIFEAYTQHANLLKSLGFEPCVDEQSFSRLPKKLEYVVKEYKANLEHFEENFEKLVAKQNVEQSRQREIEEEISSLNSRRNNIPSQHIIVREKICRAINCSEQDLPFVGELLQIKADEKALWEYAIEKVLHSYAISMLVPEKYYKDVVNYVHSNNLGMRLVFYRVKEQNHQAFNNNFKYAPVGSNSLVRKLEIKNDPIFNSYLRKSLEDGFNYVCTEDQDEYRQERNALMPSGLAKKGGRNEKDDRRGRNLNDYVLGWSNEEKIASLRKELLAITSNINSIREMRRSLKQGQSTTQSNLARVERILEVNNFAQIDYQSKDEEIKRLNQELEDLKRSSNIVEELTRQLEQLEQDLQILAKRRDNYLEESAQLKERYTLINSEYLAALEFASPAQYLSNNTIAMIEKCIEHALKILRLDSINNSVIDRVIAEISNSLEKLINNLRNQVYSVSQDLVSMQSHFTSSFVIAARNLDASRAEAWEDFKRFKEKLEQDDLPRFVTAFKDKLSRDTLEQFGTLSASFNTNCRKILERINDINAIMYDVDFNVNHYIKMVATPSNDLEIKKFRADLKQCTSNLMDENLPLEDANQKFHEVKALIDRFKGSVNGADIDGRWRKKVTDVKQWFEFSASEHSREDDSQVDYYEDSGGKSGGQKEKLAYTVLASSLAYQYRSKARRVVEGSSDTSVLSKEATLSNGTYNYSYSDRSYRFVIIDEAFGRGSPQSVDYALTLFNKFNLQLLVATPMQKLDIIEKYVNHVAFVYRDENTHESTVFNYDLEDYILKRKLKEQIARAPLKALGQDLMDENGDLNLDVNEAQALLDKLDQKMLSEQPSFKGPSLQQKQQQNIDSKDNANSNLPEQEAILVNQNEELDKAKSKRKQEAKKTKNALNSLAILDAMLKEQDDEGLAESISVVGMDSNNTNRGKKKSNADKEENRQYQHSLDELVDWDDE